MHWKKLKRVIILTKQTNLLYIIFSIQFSQIQY